jgi:uncharacterized membrane protein YjdF
MDYKKVSDAVCVTAAAVLLIMTVMAILESRRVSYEINTGLFCAVFCLVPLILRRLRIVTLPLAFVIMAETAIFLHAYGVLLAQYDIMVWWDTVTHTISSVTVSLCVFFALMAVDVFDSKVNFSRKAMVVFIILIGMTFGAYWEVFEWVVDVTTGTNMQYSPWDTIRDLLCDILGAVVVSVYAYVYLGRRSKEDFVDSLEIHPRFRNVGRSKE